MIETPAKPDSPKILKNVKGWNNDRLINILIKNSMVFVLLIVMVFFTTKNGNFATVDNLRAILISAAPFALITLGQTLVIFTGGIDLSVGSIIAVSSMTGAKLVVTFPHQIVLSIIAAVAVGLIAGLINGLIVAHLNVAPFVATLGMLTVASGLAYAIGNGAPINGLPLTWGNIANTKLLAFQIPVYVMIFSFIFFAIMMHRTAFGMRIYAVGGNRLAAQVAGVSPKRILIYVYAISGLLAGISGVILSSRVISGTPNLGVGYELSSIAAVVIGGASLSGGRGTILGSLLGLFLIQTLNNGLDILIIPSYWQKVISGFLIVSAVAVDVWATKRTSK